MKPRVGEALKHTSNTKFDRRLLVFAVILIFSPFPAFADDDQISQKDKVVGLGIRCMETMKKLAIKILMTNRENTNLVVKNLDDLAGPTFSFPLGKRLGVGFRASVYPIMTPSQGGIEMILKIPHVFHSTSIHPPFANAGIEREKEIYDALVTALPTIEADPLFPKDTAWAKGTLPTVPITRFMRTDKGNLLVKPRLYGTPIGEIYRRYQPKKATDLPAEMRESLKEIYWFTQAVYNHGRVQKRSMFSRPLEGQTEEIRLDINPNNMAWISDPAEMRVLGLKRPSFFFYEFGDEPSRFFHRDKLSLPQYYNAVINFMQADK